MTDSLNHIIKRAQDIAREMKHNILTTEHIFLAILCEQSGSDFLSRCGGNPVWMGENISNYLKKYIPTSVRLNANPIHTPALKRVFSLMYHLKSQRTNNRQNDFHLLMRP